MFGKQYLELHYSEVDKLCQWILDTRAEHEKGYKRFLKAVDEASRKADSSARITLQFEPSAQLNGNDCGLLALALYSSLYRQGPTRSSI